MQWNSFCNLSAWLHYSGLFRPRPPVRETQARILQTDTLTADAPPAGRQKSSITELQAFTPLCRPLGLKENVCWHVIPSRRRGMGLAPSPLCGLRLISTTPAPTPDKIMD